MKRFLIVISIMALAFATMSTEETTAAKQLINSNISCDKLNESQLELIGDYYMEQMHPGQAHEAMERMMGGEGSPSLKQAHIQMARVIYCRETNITATYGGMMGMMPILGGYGPGFGGGMMGYGMNGNMMGYGGWWWIFGLLFWALVFIALVLLVYWLYRNVRGGGQTASEIVKQRYAKGEITKKQYDEMKKDLEG